VKSRSFSFIKQLRSFIHAWYGLKILFKNEHNARIHLLAAILVVSAGFTCSLNAVEWCLVSLSIGLVFMAELFNTAVEYLCNHVSPGQHEQIRRIKDLTAAAVLAIVISAVIVGLIVFAPKISSLHLALWS
jgi:diacylglycerol kinase